MDKPLYAVIDITYGCQGTQLFDNLEKAIERYNNIDIDSQENSKFIIEVKIGEEFGFSEATPTPSSNHNPFYGTINMIKGEDEYYRYENNWPIYDKEKNESIKHPFDSSKGIVPDPATLTDAHSKKANHLREMRNRMEEDDILIRSNLERVMAFIDKNYVEIILNRGVPANLTAELGKDSIYVQNIIQSILR